jgi:hypothetical protein
MHNFVYCQTFFQHCTNNQNNVSNRTFFNKMYDGERNQLVLLEKMANFIRGIV